MRAQKVSMTSSLYIVFELLWAWKEINGCKKKKNGKIIDTESVLKLMSKMPHPTCACLKCHTIPVHVASFRLSNMNGRLSSLSLDRSTLSPYVQAFNTLKTMNMHCVLPNNRIWNKDKSFKAEKQLFTPTDHPWPEFKSC